MARKYTKQAVNAQLTTPNKRRQRAVVQRTPAVFASIDPSGSTSSSSTVSRKRAGTIKQSDAYVHIDNVEIPYRINKKLDGKSYIDIQDALERAYKAYHGFPIVTNTIELMVDFATTNVFLKGGNKQSQDFFHAWFKYIKVENIQEQFFREYYRSSNVIFYRLEAQLQDPDIRKFNSAYGAKIKKVPCKYILLNPLELMADGQLNFSDSRYYKTLNGYEVKKLQNPQTDQEKALSEKILDKLELKKSGITQEAVLELPIEDIITIFYRKQDYEPFGVPFIYPVLKDINWKEELKLIDKAIARTVQQVILLVTAGAEPDKGGINENALKALNNILQNESVGKTIVADHTTKAQFVIPQVGDILDPKKYEIVNEDIKAGLNNMLLGDDKFANAQIKIETFVNRLEKGQSTFIREFLEPEMKRLGKMMGFKTIPTAYCKKIKVRDTTQQLRIFTQLAQLGLLTPEEVFQAIEDGIIPDGDMAIEKQKEYKEQRDKGYWMPLVGGSDKGDENGRPTGSGTPKTTDTKVPQGTTAKEISLSKIVKSTQKVSSFLEEAGDKADIAEIVMANEDPRWWKRKLKEYAKNPLGKNPDKEKEIDQIAIRNSVSNLEAIILYHAIH